MTIKIKRQIVGEGTYGCVVEPALECKNPQDTINKVSKVMRKQDAKDELKEYRKLKKIPGIENYTLDFPILCEAKFGMQFSNIVRECNGTRVRTTYKENPNDLALLLLENGGLDLDNFTSNIFPKLENKEKNRFLTSILELIKGVKFFNDNDIIHQDIKGGNIVYNVETGKIKFIDFGLMVNKSEFIKNSKESVNEMAESWSYFPPENSCANKISYQILQKCKLYRKVYKEVGGYRTFIKDIANSFDSYCLGLALRNIMNDLKVRKHYKEKKDFLEESYLLFLEYSDMNVFTRNDSLTDLEERYKGLLKKYGIYNSEQPTPSLEIIKKAEQLSLKSDKFYTPVKDCPSKRPDFNPKTKKCVNACNTGKVRNENYRCVNMKKTIKRREPNSILRECIKEKKDYNPFTKRCVKPCKPTQKRNSKYRCVSMKTRKQRTKVV